MSRNIEQGNNGLIIGISELSNRSSPLSGLDIDKFKEEVASVNQDIDQFNKFTLEYKNKNFLGKAFTFGVDEQIIYATAAIARLGKLTLEMQAFTSVIAAGIHANTSKLNAQQHKINTQQNVLEEQGEIVIGIPDLLREYQYRVEVIRTTLKGQIDADIRALKIGIENLRIEAIDQLSSAKELIDANEKRLIETSAETEVKLGEQSGRLDALDQEALRLENEFWQQAKQIAEVKSSYDVTSREFSNAASGLNDLKSNFSKLQRNLNISMGVTAVSLLMAGWAIFVHA
jgi:chromosome segregation ATPase